LADDIEALVPLVERTAALARLEVSAADAAGLARDFARILSAFRSLADAAGAPAGGGDARGAEEGFAPAPRLRPDAPAPAADAHALLRAAPEAEIEPVGGFLAVPKTVGDEA